jgi:transcriptional antiterminator RfaH
MGAGAGKRWFVAHTLPREERKAARHLIEQGYDVFLPLYAKKWRHARKVELRATPLFPRYLFVAIDLTVDRWLSVNGTIGVRHLVSFGGRPEPIAHGIVEELLSRCDTQGFISLSRRAHKPGDAVRVASGVFESALGLFEGATDAQRVAILLDVLGRKVRVVLDSELIEAA